MTAVESPLRVFRYRFIILSVKTRSTPARGSAPLGLIALACLASGACLALAAAAAFGAPASALPPAAVGAALLAAAALLARGLDRLPERIRERTLAEIGEALGAEGPDLARSPGVLESGEAVRVSAEDLAARIRADREWIAAQRQASAMETERDLAAAHEREELKVRLDTSVRSRLAAVDSTLEEVRSSADRLLEASERTRGTGGEVETAASAVSEILAEVTAALRELRESAGRISREMYRTSEISETAVSAIAGTTGSVEELEASTVRIGEIVGLIDEIAERTNLLALNAAIEAARAGSAGKGFAVVAGEVKKLAAQTGKATLDIKSLIDGVQAGARRARESSSETKEAVGRLDEVISGVASAVTSQEAAVGRVETGAAGLAGANEQVRSGARGLAAEVGETESLAEGIRRIAGRIAEEGGRAQEGGRRLPRVHRPEDQPGRQVPDHPGRPVPGGERPGSRGTGLPGGGPLPFRGHLRLRRGRRGPLGHLPPEAGEQGPEHPGLRGSRRGPDRRAHPGGR